MNREIRIPKQKRSIEKKEKIVQTAYKIFNEKGYHNTNTAEIAKEAGFSTGCLYDYFIDKSHLFFEALKMHNNDITTLITNKFKELPDNMNLYDTIFNFIHIFMEAHNHSIGFHKEVMALSYSNSEINDFLKSYNNSNTIKNLILYFSKRNINLSIEKAHLFLNTVDSVCHDLLYNYDDSIEIDTYISECAHMLEFMLNSKF